MSFRLITLCARRHTIYVISELPLNSSWHMSYCGWQDESLSKNIMNCCQCHINEWIKNKQLWQERWKMRATHVLEEMYFAPKNCFFSLFCELQKWKWNFQAALLQLSYVVIYLVNWYKLEKSCFKNPFSILQLKNKAKKAIFWSKIHFFSKMRNFRKSFALCSQTFQTFF